MTEPDLARRLLDAHVAHQVAELRGVRFLDLVTGEVDFALRNARDLTLDRVMHRSRVKEVAYKYVSTFRLPGAIPEVAASIATRLREHPANATPLAEVVSRQRVAELVEAIVEMRALREQLLRGLADNAGLQAGVNGLVRGAATDAVDRGRRIAGNLPGYSTAEKVAGRVAGRVVGSLGRTQVAGAVDQRTRELAERAAGQLLGYLTSTAGSVSDEELRDAVLEVWDALATRPVREFAELIDDEQLVAVFVGLYEVWLDVRDSDYLTALVDTGVDFFFDTYGSFTLDKLLEEWGLSRDDLIEEALRFGPPVIEALAETGVLEQLVRRRLAAFYDSPEAQALLGS
ncbi:MAG: hypothetical protein J2O46_05165 [Nocardioides sp.]|nr:hypothetical protein [Nocardioides sp.]